MLSTDQPINYDHEQTELNYQRNEQNQPQNQSKLPRKKTIKIPISEVVRAQQQATPTVGQHSQNNRTEQKFSDSQITLYGGFLFKCALDKLSKIDIDVQFEESSEYDTMKALLDIVRDSGLCYEPRIDIDHDLSYIDLLLCDSNINVRLTSGYNTAIHLSKLIQIYTKFDPRVLQLLRLLRIFAKVSNIDRPDLGILHPVVFHLMIIYFLQQLEEPILPCLHEYVFGVEQVPIKLKDNQ
ncbi:unnamed protein product [Adineta steineri]|uniref:Uncharacterized protein n=1 Tax=Adineta steineri TaxID=433720 RepID=A0A814LWP8_9BILA|nr:unnamed protein product [Adineta steineri]